MTFKELFKAVHFEGCFTMWQLTCQIERLPIAELHEHEQRKLFMSTHDDNCPIYKDLIYKNQFFFINTKERFIDFYDELIRISVFALAKHKNASTNAELLFKQIELFSQNPCGLVFVHCDENKKIDMLFVGLAVPVVENPWMEVIALWCKTGKFKELRDEGVEIIRKYIFERFKIDREFTAVTRSPKILFKKFYEPLGYKIVGYVLEKGGRDGVRANESN